VKTDGFWVGVIGKADELRRFFDKSDEKVLQSSKSPILHFSEALVGKADESGRPSSGNPMTGMTPGTPLVYSMRVAHLCEFEEVGHRRRHDVALRPQARVRRVHLFPEAVGHAGGAEAKVDELWVGADWGLGLSLI
jgi:hypothetical protein